ncbi:MAG: MarR family transcriptional regulator [Nitratireductor sp.]
MKQKIFLNERLTYRLDVLAEEAIASNDDVFVQVVGCTIREVRVLRIIDDNPGINFQAIVSATRLERSLVSRIIQRLLSSGWIERQNVAGDARKYHLSTTAEGRRARLRARKLADELEEILLSPLSKEQLMELTESLEKLAGWVRSENYRDLVQGYSRGKRPNPEN